MDSPLVSIIIPTYNRAHLISETLDSIIAQTYTNWECIVVDDGSTDDTNTVMAKYIAKDSRIQYHHRPKDRLPGGNAARNYGFQISNGKYVNWFDSDDIMKPDFIGIKLQVLEETNVDFVISNSINFDEHGNEFNIYSVTNLDKEITAENYIGGIINWITNDVMTTRSSIGDLRFNEKLKSSQEYNFYSRYLIKNTNGSFINKTLSMRRVHSGSIQEKLNDNLLKKKSKLLENEIIFLNDIEKIASKTILNRSLNRIIRFNYETQNKFTINQVQFLILKKIIRYGNFKNVALYTCWMISNLVTGKGYFFLKKIKF